MGRPRTQTHPAGHPSTPSSGVGSAPVSLATTSTSSSTSTSTSPLLHPARLLKSTSSSSLAASAHQVALMSGLLQLDPLLSTQIPPSIEEELETQARTTLGLFGFGSAHDAINWSIIPGLTTDASISTSTSSYGLISLPALPLSTSTNNQTTMNASLPSPNASIALSERVCPIGKNSFLWNVLQEQKNASIAEAILTGASSSSNINGNDPNTLKLDPYAADTLSSAASMSTAASTFAESDLFSNYATQSKLLQHYFVKCTAVFPASVEEVVDLIIRSDKEDCMDVAMQHMVGVRTTGAGWIYRRARKQPSHASRSSRATMTSQEYHHQFQQYHRQRRRRRRRDLDQEQQHPNQAASESSESETDEDNQMLHHQSPAMRSSRLPRTSSTPSLRSAASRKSSLHSSSSRSRSRLQSADRVVLRSPSASPVINGQTAFSPFMEEYHASHKSPEGGYHQGNLSLKWVAAERGSRMFSSRVHYCVTDYECIVWNDWDDSEDSGPMYVRTLQSCYLPQCQPWIEEFNAKPTDLQPSGIMVRQAKQKEGCVEVQFVASVLEKAHQPVNSRRAKLRTLAYRISKLEEIITSRRLSQSLLLHQPLWVRNGERSVCHCCEAKFHLSRRRHHCRLCGEICCSDCCPKIEVALPDVGSTSVRVCVFCVKKRRHSSDSIASSSSSSTTMLSTVQNSPTTTIGLSTRLPPPTNSMYLSPSLSSSSDYLASSYSSSSGRDPVTFGLLSDQRKGSNALSSTMLQKFKSHSLGL